MVGLWGGGAKMSGLDQSEPASSSHSAGHLVCMVVAMQLSAVYT